MTKHNRLHASSKRLEKTTITASEARNHFYHLMDWVSKSHKPVTIFGRRTNAVLISGEDWEAIQETLFLMGNPGVRDSIKDAMA